MDSEQNKQPRLTIRVAKGSLSFSVPDNSAGTQIIYEPYVPKSGVSMPANLREAFKTVPLLSRPLTRAQVLIDFPSLLIPVEEYNEANNAQLYFHSFPEAEGRLVMSNVLPQLNAVALFAVNKDLKLVVDDHFPDVRFTLLMRPVWDYLRRRSAVGNRRKLFAYYHDNVLELVSFERNRFIFANRYEARHVKDLVYFILFVWKQLALDQQRDELFLVGNLLDKDALLDTLRKYIQVVSVINPSASFNRAPLTQLRGITFDLITLYLG